MLKRTAACSVFCWLQNTSATTAWRTPRLLVPGVSRIWNSERYWLQCCRGTTGLPASAQPAAAINTQQDIDIRSKLWALLKEAQTHEPPDCQPSGAASSSAGPTLTTVSVQRYRGSLHLLLQHVAAQAQRTRHDSSHDLPDDMFEWCLADAVQHACRSSLEDVAKVLVACAGICKVASQGPRHDDARRNAVRGMVLHAAAPLPQALSNKLSAMTAPVDGIRAWQVATAAVAVNKLASVQQEVQAGLHEGNEVAFTPDSAVVAVLRQYFNRLRKYGAEVGRRHTRWDRAVTVAMQALAGMQASLRSREVSKQLYRGAFYSQRCVHKLKATLPLSQQHDSLSIGG
jgi:hypothetical protein